MNKSPAYVSENLQKMLLGIHKYQTHEYEPAHPTLDTIWTKGAVRLRVIQAQEEQTDTGASSRETLLLIPSLINKSYIFDLTAERSMLRWFSEKNMDLFLLDWGNSAEDEGQKNLEGVIRDRLIPALEFVRERQGKKIHALGYCMGGTILLGAATQTHDILKSIILLAAPWDFHAGSQALLDRIKFWAPTVLPALDEKGALPVEWIQTLFASLDPEQGAEKFARFYDMERNSAQEKLFIAVEDWLNDGVDLPTLLARECIAGWYLKNEPLQNEWRIGEHTVSPETLECPALVIASSKDRLVEFETAAILAEKIPKAKLLDPACGHIGMIAGRNAVEDVWGKVGEWISSFS
ncbi:MAG: alpha/beta fold hydrolase [Alphaproteobacteria bacterium]|nr:alpha/beta fold hydrolase [Alphaproteobacteria bacterium]